MLSDLELSSPPAAFQYLNATGGGGVSAIHERLIDGHQSLRRFPVLYYFHPEREGESVTRLLSAPTVLCALALGAAGDPHRLRASRRPRP